MTASVQPAPVVEPEVCPSCGTGMLGTYCHRCGEKMFHEKDLSVQHFVQHGLHELTHLDSKIVVTLRYLFTRPGFLTQEYLAGRRLHYAKPLGLFLLACAAFFTADSIWPIDIYNLQRINRQDKAGKASSGWETMAAIKHVSKEAIAEQMEGTVHKLGTAAQLTNALAMAVVLAVLYRRRYFTGHLVFACHFFVFNFFALILLSALLSAGHWKIKHLWIWLAEGVVFVSYLFFALRRVYAGGVAITILKAITTYVTTQFLTFVMFLVMILIAAVITMLS